jgi:group I intron endonuclease
MIIYSIYKITNVLTLKCYIGKSANPAARFRVHLSEAFRNKYKNYFHNSLRKYGANIFVLEIIESNITDESVAYAQERHWIKIYNTVSPNGYNSNQGGKGGSLGVKMTDETIAKRYLNKKPKGWYVTPLGKFRAANLSPFATNTIQRWCKNPDKIIGTNSYSKSKYLQAIGTAADISIKTYRDIGFWYEPFN